MPQRAIPTARRIRRRLLGFFWDELSLSLVFTAFIPIVAYIGFRNDHSNRWVIAVAGAAAFATALAVHESVQMRRAMVYPRVTVTWRQGASTSITIFRNIGVGTAYLTNLRVEKSYESGERERGMALQPSLILPPGQAVHFAFGDSDRFDRATKGFQSLRVQANLSNIFGKRLLAVDEEFKDTEMWKSDGGDRIDIWWHENREGSFIP